MARINEDKPDELYEALFAKLFQRCQGMIPGHKFRFNNSLYSLDTSTIDLCLSVFPWAKFRTTKSAIKLHVGLNHNGHLPEFITVTDGKVGDVTVGRRIDSPKGSIVAIDRGYNDYSGYKQLTDKQIFFVTRLKSNANIIVIERRPVLKSKGLICDEVIKFTGVYTAKKMLHCITSHRIP